MFAAAFLALCLSGCAEHLDKPEISFSELMQILGFWTLIVGAASIVIAIKSKFWQHDYAGSSPELHMLVAFGWAPIMFLIVAARYIAWSASWDWMPPGP